MINVILYALFLATFVSALFFLVLYTFALILSSFMGSPYVPTGKREVKQILKEINPKPDQIFLELGCGDARMLREAVRHYEVKGIGIDINPIIILLAKCKSLFKKQHIELSVGNILGTDLKNADIIYIFLMPELIEKLSPKLRGETKRGTIIVSHGFKIEDLKDWLYKTLPDKPFPTYFYKAS